MYGLRGLGADVISTAGDVASVAPAPTAINTYLAAVMAWTAPSQLSKSAQNIFGADVAKLYGSSIQMAGIAGFLTPVVLVAWLMFGRGGGRGR
jgi:hypothetical protein